MFVGGKMAAEYFSYKLGNEISLLIVSLILIGGTVMSILTKRVEKKYYHASPFS